MGSDKARADSGGRAMALRVAAAAACVCESVSLVGDPIIYRDLGLPVIPDRFAGQGPLAGIEAALAASKCVRNLIIACDMPAISENLLEELFSTDGDCVLPATPTVSWNPFAPCTSGGAILWSETHSMQASAESQTFSGFSKLRDLRYDTFGCPIRPSSPI